METILDIFIQPARLIESLESKPTWIGAFFAVVGGISLLTWLKSCLRGNAIIIDIGVLVGAVISSTVSFLLLWLVIALYLFAMTVMLSPTRPIRFKQVFSLVSYCGVIFFIGEVMNFVLLHTPFLHDFSPILPDRFPLGLDIFFIRHPPGLLPSIILYTVNPITIWYLRLLVLGIHRLSGLNNVKASMIVVSLWASGITFLLSVVSILGGTRIGITL